jgi:hypothetical protein
MVFSEGVTAIAPDGTPRLRSYNAPEGLPKAAREVLEQLTREQDEARREAHRKIEQARADAVRELKQLQDRYTKAGQLDEAIAVRDVVRGLQADSAAGHATRTRGIFDRSDIRALADPGSLTAYRDKVGQRFNFDVTGATEGNVWGNVIYTDDSTLAAAAVHAGVLTPGQRGVVKVTILPGRGSYAGSDSNGVQSRPYQAWPGSYMVEAVDSTSSDPDRLEPAPVTPGVGGPNYLGGGPRRHRSSLPGATPGYPPVPGDGVLPAPAAPPGPASGAGDLQELRDKVGQSIETDLVGSTQGRVWGTDIYTDDSSPAAAAVHAGVLRDGESGRVTITILPAQDSYQGSDRHGVSSQPWQTWGGSFRIERADKVSEDRSSGSLDK